MSKPAESLYDLPPSAKLVFKVLEVNGPLTQSEIAAETLLARRTVRHALERLLDAGFITKAVYFRDARKSIYRLRETPKTTREITNAEQR